MYTLNEDLCSVEATSKYLSVTAVACGHEVNRQMGANPEEVFQGVG
jgi:hypothetical protein